MLEIASWGPLLLRQPFPGRGARRYSRVIKRHSWQDRRHGKNSACLPDLASFGYLRIMGGSWRHLFALPFHLTRQAREGAVADKSTQLILDALSRAVAEPGGVPLHGNKKAPGLFATTATAKHLALRCKEEGLLRVLHAENGSKTTHELCTLTEKGLTYLLNEVSPKQVLEDLVRALEARHAHVGELVAAARRWQEGLDALQATVQRVLDQLQKPGKLVAGAAPSANGSERWLAAVMAYLAEWQRADKTSDCPLPDLYRV